VKKDMAVKLAQVEKKIKKQRMAMRYGLMNTIGKKFSMKTDRIFRLKAPFIPALDFRSVFNPGESGRRLPAQSVLPSRNAPLEWYRHP
jgi:hypothetical protein